MKIMDFRVLKGPNYWSVRRPELIVMLLDLEEMENFPTNHIPGFSQRLQEAMPSLYSHRCSEGVPGGFFHRVETGTWLGHVIEHVALEMQTLAGMDTGFGRTRETNKRGIYHVVYSYLGERSGIYAGRASVKFIEALAANIPFDLQHEVDILKNIWEEEKPGPAQQLITAEAEKRNIPVIVQENHEIQLGYGIHQKKFVSPEALPPEEIIPAIERHFPEGSDGRIPVIAVTGTNGKTTTTRLIAHIVKQQGYRTGYTTTDGIYIQDQMVVKGDCTGPVSAQHVFSDPSVEFAVLESARGGLLRAGLGFRWCDVAVITNVAEDHLGLQGIDTIRQMARVKSVLTETVTRNGFAVLNADDDLVYDMRRNTDGNIALFSVDEKNEHVQRHSSKVGMAAVYENGYISILHGNDLHRIEAAKNIPLSFEGKALFNISNLLAASLAAYCIKIPVEIIRRALVSFIPSSESTPGRMNIYDFGSFRLMLDYAHNPHGLRALGQFIKEVEASVKIGIIAGVGDRRDHDIIAVGEESARIFDEIIIRQDEDLRGRSGQEINDLLCKGIRNISPDKKITSFTSENDSVDFAFNNAPPGSFVVILVENVMHVTGLVQKYVSEKFPERYPPAELMGDGHE